MTRLQGEWLAHEGSQHLLTALEAAGHPSYFVGGCVRDALLDRPVGDIDMASPARPETVQQIAQGQGFKVVPTGIDHGTVTVIADGRPHEVTTFRADLETDGRRARVGFTGDMAGDAARRDFTMNALYADRHGVLHDPLGGLPDLMARRVRFIGDPGQRIREDYLRILRFFRFHAWFGDPAEGPDAEGLAACAELAEGLDQLSAERVGAEIKKLLAAPDPSPAVAAMAQSGVLGRVLPGADPRALAPLVHLEAAAGVAPAPLRRLAALGGQDPAATLRLSKKEARHLALLREGQSALAGSAELAYRHGADPAREIELLRAAGYAAPLPATLESDLASGAAARFPVRAADLAPRFSGAELGAALRRLERVWIDAGFALDRQALLSLLDDPA